MDITTVHSVPLLCESRVERKQKQINLMRIRILGMHFSCKWDYKAKGYSAQYYFTTSLLQQIEK